MKKIVSNVMLVLILISTLTIAFKIQQVKAEPGTIYIKADGSVDPPTAPVLNIGNIYYTFMDNIYDSIVVERSNIIINGAGYLLQSVAIATFGFGLYSVNNVTIKNVNIKGFHYGILLFYSSFTTISGNNITGNTYGGIYLHYSDNNVMLGNDVTATSGHGIWLVGSSGNNISRNIITANKQFGIWLQASPNNSIYGNNVTSNKWSGIHVYQSDNNIISANNLDANGIETLGAGIRLQNSSGNNVFKNNLKNNYDGTYIHDYSSKNSIIGNSMVNNEYGITFSYSFGNTISENVIEKNDYGIRLYYSSNNIIYHNDLINNIYQASIHESVNVWDNSYPSGGNYWSDYASMDLYSGPNQDQPGSDGIGDTPYIIDSYNIDRYPLMKPWTPIPQPENRPPTCIIKLEKDGVEINEVNVGEFFDIYVGDSTDDTGIAQVRFSSDDVQDGIPTGEWTKWYEWDVSSEDWDAVTKIKRWAFATPGHKEVWAEVKDGVGLSNLCSDIIFVPAPALPMLVSPLVITPSKEIYNIGDTLEAEFTIKNVGNIPITLDVLCVGGRLNGFIPREGPPDFTHLSVTLQPNESYQYQGTLTLTKMGNYHFFVAYYIENPTPEEKKLLDENYWNTCVDLGEGLTHGDRVKNIMVYEEGVVPEDVFELYETINRWISRERQYPAYLIDPDQGSWAASVWVTISSVWTHVQEEYDELWYAGVDHDCLSRMEAIYAKRFLDKGDIDGAKEHLQYCFLHYQISNIYFGAAAEIFDANIKQGEEMMKSALKLIEVGVTLLNPMAGKFASYMFMAPNYIADMDLVGIEQAQKNAVRDLIFKVIFSEYKFPELGDRTFENYLNNRIGKITFPYLQKLFENNEALQFYLSKVLKEAAAEGMEWLYDKADSLSEKTVEELSKRFESYIYKKFSPIELRVLNPQGGMTGQINGRVRHDISRSFYRNGTVVIFFPSDSYTCEVIGKEEGTYSLEITSVEAWNTTTFNATNIPVSANTTHQYTIDWVALSLGEEGVFVQVDFDGDGVFEHTFTSDGELTESEYIIATDNTPPETLVFIGDPKFVVDNLTYLSSATPTSLIAEDNVGGSGVALTAYRIYNASYDSGWITYTQPFYLSGLSDGIYYIDFNSTDYAGNVEPTNTITVILDNTPPETTITIGEPKYVSDTIYVTPETPFTLSASDEGSGIFSTAYRIYNSTYDSGWLTYTEPFNLTALTNGIYTIEYYSIDNLGNVETTRSIQITLFSWNYVFTDSYGRGTTLKINLAHKFFQFITPDKDYGIRNATYMRVYKRAIIIYHKDNELKLATISIDTQLDFCIAYAKDTQTGKEYWLIDKAGNE